MGGSLWLVTAGLLLLSCGSVSPSFFSSSSSSGNPAHSYDLSYKELRVVLGQRVERVRMMERPLDNFLGSSIKGFASHSGVEVVTEDGRHFLIHKGKDYGTKKGGNTVVVDAKNMSKKWKPVTVWKVPDKKTRVTDMVKAGGKDYRWFRDNCHNASKNIMYGGKKKDKGIYLKPYVPKKDRIPKKNSMGFKKEDSSGRFRSEGSGGRYRFGSGGSGGRYETGNGYRTGGFGRRRHGTGNGYRTGGFGGRHGTGNGFRTGGFGGRHGTGNGFRTGGSRGGNVFRAAGFGSGGGGSRRG